MLNWILGIVFFILLVYTLYILITGPKPKNLSKLIWILIVIFLPYIGIIVYWIVEKKILS